MRFTFIDAEKAFYPLVVLCRVWVTDVTFVWTLQGWLYLAAILDLFSQAAALDAGIPQPREF